MKTITLDLTEEIMRAAYEAYCSDKGIRCDEDYELKKDSRWVPVIGDKYYYLDECNDPEESEWEWENCREDKYRLNTNNVFKTIEEAMKEQKRRQALADVTQYCYENDLVLVDIDWDNANQEKHEIGYDFGATKFSPCYNCYVKYSNQLPYLKSEEACEQVIEDCKEDLKIIFNVK